MAQMAIRPPQFWINPLGSLAEEYSVYIGKPNEDATQPSSQITLMDGLSGAAIAQPFIITNGIARNTQGQQVLPTITATRYSIKFVDNDGVEVYAEEDFFSDAFGLDQEAALTADRILDSLADALVTDLTDLNYIFCKSENAGWEASLPGPDLNTYFFYTGEADAGKAGTKETDPQTGDFSGIFYDSVGNQWKIVPQPYVNATGLIDQSIDGRKTFLSDVTFESDATFEQNIIQANDKYFYIEGTNGDIEGPSAIRIRIDTDGLYQVEQKNEAGDLWVNIESILNTGQRFIQAKKNSYVNGIDIFNTKGFSFRNRDSESEGENSISMDLGFDDFFRLRQVQDGILRARLVIKPDGDESISILSKGVEQALIEVAGNQASNDTTVITREKGDARYARVENFQLTTASNFGLPSGWSVSRSDAGAFQNLVVTHNLGARLYPVISRGNQAPLSPYVLSSDTNKFTIVASSSFGSTTNILVKI